MIDKESSIIPFDDEEEEVEFVVQMIYTYIKAQIKLGRNVIKLSEIYEFCGSEFEGAEEEDIDLVLTDSGANVVSLWDHKRKNKLH